MSADDLAYDRFETISPGSTPDAPHPDDHHGLGDFLVDITGVMVTCCCQKFIGPCRHNRVEALDDLDRHIADATELEWATT